MSQPVRPFRSPAQVEADRLLGEQLIRRTRQIIRERYPDVRLDALLADPFTANWLKDFAGALHWSFWPVEREANGLARCARLIMEFNRGPQAGGDA